MADVIEVALGGQEEWQGIPTEVVDEMQQLQFLDTVDHYERVSAFSFSI